MSTDMFCPLPWVSQSTRNDGVFRVCAHAQNSPCRGEAKDISGQRFTAHQSDWDEAQNAASLKAIRADFLKNKWPSACQRCEGENQNGIASRQLEERKRYRHIFGPEQARAITADDGTLHRVEPMELDLRLGNRCNLKCTMCSPKSSDLWYQDHAVVWGRSFKNWKDEIVPLEPAPNGVRAADCMNEWYDSPHFMNQLESRLRSVRILHFTGGEPVVTKRVYDVLEMMVQLGTAAESTVQFITNGTVLPKKLLQFFPHFKQIKIGVSVDSVGEKNDYIRFPSKWNQVASILSQLDQSAENVHSWLVATTMVYNIFYLPELLEWRDEMNFIKINNNGDRMILSDHPLHNPGYLSSRILPPQVKRVVAAKLLNYSEEKKSFASCHLEKHHEIARANVKSIIDANVNFMMSEDHSHLLPKFFKYTERLDKVRGNSFWQTFPELAALLEPFVVQEGLRERHGELV